MTTKQMTMREAAALAERLWSSAGTAFTATVGIVQRKRTSPRFMVGMAYLDGTKAVTFGTSNVDWESAFGNAAQAGYAARIAVSIKADAP